MSDNFAADSFHTKKLCSRFCSSEVRFSERELSLRRGKTIVLDRHQIRVRITVSLAVRFGSLSYDDMVQAVQNTIDSCINSATDRRGYVLEQVY